VKFEEKEEMNIIPAQRNKHGKVNSLGRTNKLILSSLKQRTKDIHFISIIPPTRTQRKTLYTH
jgi:hypothetical protein